MNTVKAANPGVSQHEILRILGGKYKNLPEEQKEDWREDGLGMAITMKTDRLEDLVEHVEGEHTPEWQFHQDT